jgi:chaperonin GroES
MGVERSYRKMSVGIKPINDYILIKRVEAEEKTKSGIILSGQAKEQPQIAEVIAVGPGTDEVKIVVKEGDKVIFGQYGGMDIKYDGEEFKLVKQSDIYATVK